MKQFLLAVLLVKLTCITSFAQQTRNYPNQTFNCSVVTAGIPVLISYTEQTKKITLKVAADTCSIITGNKNEAEKFLLEKIRQLLLKNCPPVSPADYDVKVPLLARDAANYFLNSGILKVDTMKITDNKELRLYTARGEYYLSIINPFNGNSSDLMKKVNGEYTFDVAVMNREKLAADKIAEFLKKHAASVKAPGLYLLESNKLFIKNPAAGDSGTIYTGSDTNYVKKIKGPKAGAAELAGTDQKVLYTIKSGASSEQAKPEEEGKPAEEKPAKPASVAKEALLAEDSITCKPDSSFTLAAYTYPKNQVDSFMLKGFTANKTSKEERISLQILEAAFIHKIETEYSAKCTNAEVRKNIAKFLKNVKSEVAKKSEADKQLAALSKQNEELKEQQKILNNTIETLAGEQENAVVLQVRREIPLYLTDAKPGQGEKGSAAGAVLVVDSITLTVQFNSIYEVAIVGKIDGKPVKTLFNNQYALNLLALNDAGQQLNAEINGITYYARFCDVFFLRPGNGRISQELRDGDYTFNPGKNKDTILHIQQKRLIDYISASAFIDLQAFNAENPNKNLSTELYFSYHINPHNIKRGFGMIKNAYLPITLGFNLFKQGDGMPTYRKPVPSNPANPTADTISYQYYFKNLDLLKHSFMQVRPMMNLFALDLKKRRLLIELNGGYLLMGSNSRIIDPAKGVDSSYSKPVYSYSWLLESRFRLAPRPRYGLDLHVIYSFGLRPFSTDMKSATGDYTIKELGRANLLKDNKDDFILGELNFYFNPRKQKSDTDKGGLYFKLNWYKSVHYSDGHFMFLVGYSTDIKNFFR